MLNDVFQKFTSPPSSYRGAPFWSWNGRLESKELRRQVRLMHTMGLGGFFIHSRVGLMTPYLSREWMDCVQACIDEAQKLGMRAWLYDEDRWPSGFAGGLVTEHPEYRQQYLGMVVYEHGERFDWDDTVLAVFAAEVNMPAAYNIRRLGGADEVSHLDEKESLLVFRVSTVASAPGFNGFTYVDTLSDEAVGEFIRVTHEAYAEHFQDYFGNVVPGIFTDEPQHIPKDSCSCDQDGYTVRRMPWTPRLPEVFRRRYGYDLLPDLVTLFFDPEGIPYSEVRYHFHECVAYLFTDAFARQIGEWCERHGIDHTGHVMSEPTLSSQNKFVGDCMRFYEYMQAPGMDLLTQYNREYDTAKQVSSVAHQFGRRWRLSETYGATGWDFPFLGHKALGDWQAALGINLRCQHLSWYTMEGQAKRDYPASIFYQSPWWPFYRKVENYFARINAVMSEGDEVRDVLVIHPQESMWMLTRAGWEDMQEVKDYDAMLRSLRDSLLGANIDFDYGNEEIISRHGKVVEEPSPELRVNKAGYKVVLLPPMITIRRTTLDLLSRFKAAGGSVIIFGGLPECEDGVRSGHPAKELEGSPIVDRDDLQGVVQRLEPEGRRLSIKDAETGQEIPDVLYLLRESEDAFLCFICNTSHDFRDEQADTAVSERTRGFAEAYIEGFSGCQGTPLELDPDTGEVFTTPAEPSDAGWRIRSSFPRLASRLFIAPKHLSAHSFPVKHAYREKEEREEKLEGPWAIQRSEPNTLVLDKPRYSIGDGGWNDAEEILQVDRAVRKSLGLDPRGGAMIQPWIEHEEDRTVGEQHVSLCYEFDVTELPEETVWLGLENPERYSIDLNGHRIDPDTDSGWWVDRSLRTLPIDPAQLCLGRNTLQMRLVYDASFPGLEIVYLLGDFGVTLAESAPRITSVPTSLEAGDWTKQGMPFYAGHVTYNVAVQPQVQSHERCFLRLDEYHGVAVRVLIDNQEVGLIAWPPNELEITHYFRENLKSRNLSVQVLGHRRNSHGPLHQRNAAPRAVGPSNFEPAEDDWYEGCNLVPCGLQQPPKLILKQYE